PGRANLDAAVAVDLTVDVTRDGHLRSSEPRRDVGLFLDDDRALAVDFTLHRAEQTDRAFALQGTLECRAFADQALDVDTVRDAARQSVGRQSDVHIARRWAEAGAGCTGCCRWQLRSRGIGRVMDFGHS